MCTHSRQIVWRDLAHYLLPSTAFALRGSSIRATAVYTRHDIYRYIFVKYSAFNLSHNFYSHFPALLKFKQRLFMLFLHPHIFPSTQLFYLAHYVRVFPRFALQPLYLFGLVYSVLDL